MITGATCPYCGVDVHMDGLGAFAFGPDGGTMCAVRQPGDTRVFLLHGWRPEIGIPQRSGIEEAV